MARARTTEATVRYSRKADDYREDIEGLRARGLSYRAIVGALWWFRGVSLTAEQVSYALGAWGERPMASTGGQPLGGVDPASASG